jgi:RNA polymerase sigma-70 factor, ECF subfamily
MQIASPSRSVGYNARQVLTVQTQWTGISLDSASENVTLLLQNLNRGSATAEEKLISAVYNELRRLAAHYMRRERPDHTLQATALVHEAFMKLTEQKNVDWQGKAHFFGVAANVMRRILIDYARARLRTKRGSGGQKLSLDEGLLLTESRSAELLAVNDAMDRLEKLDPRQARIVELRFFGGLSVEETAEVVGVSPKTVKRDWSLAKAWLYEDLRVSNGNDPGKMAKGKGTV